MADPLHSIRAETLSVEIATEALAVALQPRISDLNRQRLLPVIERVLGEVDIPGRHIRIDRLAVDLGTLPLDGLEENTEAALYEALHQALRAAIDGEGLAGAATAEARPEEGDASRCSRIICKRARCRFGRRGRACRRTAFPRGAWCKRCWPAIRWVSPP